MPDRYLSAIQTAKLLAVTGGGTVVSAVSVMIQLNEPHAFLHLQLPYWYFLIATILLVFVGAILAMTNDYMRLQGTFLSNLLLAATVGFVISFVILPAVDNQPTVIIMMMTAFFSGLLGTIFLRILLDVMTDDELRSAVKVAVRSVVIDSLTIVASGIKRFLTKWFGGDK